MSSILNCMLIDPYFCFLAIAQIVSWIGFITVAIWAIHKVLFVDREDECYEQ